jgi:uncharacterized protein DUF4231
VGDENAVALRRLVDQLGWFSTKSAEQQRKYKTLKGSQLLATAGVTVAGAASADAAATAGLGASVLVLEGLLQMGQYHSNWTGYRSVAEALKREQQLYLADAGPYLDPTTSSRVLAERVEDLVSREHAKWVSAREQVARDEPGAPKAK